MAPKHKPPDLTRRSPRQVRSVQTVEAIFEAAAQVLEAEGLAALSTNRVAERAGTSIGTLYQYFPNRDAILIAMARRELARDRVAMERAVAEAWDGSTLELARATIRTLIRLHRERHAVRHMVMRVHIAHGLGEEHISPVQEIARRIGTQRSADENRTSTPMDATRLFVATRAVIGVIRSAALEQPALLDEPDFEAEVVAMAVYILNGPSTSPARGAP